MKYASRPLVHYSPHAAKYVHPSAAPVPLVQQVHPGPAAHYAAPQLVKYSPHGDKYVEPHPQYVKTDVYDTPPHYEYAYNVHDELSGDVKSHAEKRNGDSVVGSYTIIDPDGEYSLMEP